MKKMSSFVCYIGMDSITEIRQFGDTSDRDISLCSSDSDKTTSLDLGTQGMTE